MRTAAATVLSWGALCLGTACDEGQGQTDASSRPKADEAHELGTPLEPRNATWSGVEVELRLPPGAKEHSGDTFDVHWSWPDSRFARLSVSASWMARDIESADDLVRNERHVLLTRSIQKGDYLAVYEFPAVNRISARRLITVSEDRHLLVYVEWQDEQVKAEHDQAARLVEAIADSASAKPATAGG